MPAQNSVHIDRLLSSIAVAFKQSKDEFIADQLMPKVKAEKESDKYVRYALNTFFRRPSARGIKRAPGAEYVRRDYDVTTDSFQCEEYGVEHPLDDRTKDNADEGYRVEQIPVEILTMDVLRERELRVQQLLTSTANLTQNTTLSGTSQFNDSNSDPIGVVETACDTIIGAAGVMPNVMVIPRQVWRYMKHHPDLLDRIKFKDRTNATLSPANLEEIFDGSLAPNCKILIPWALYDNTKEGATSSLSYVWGKDILFGYVNPSPVKEEPTLGYTMEKLALSVARYREESKRSDIFRALEIVDEKLVEATCGYLVKSAVA